MNRFTGGLPCGGNVSIVASGAPIPGRPLSTVSTAARHHGALFSRVPRIFPQDAVTIDGENTRLRPGDFFLPPLRARPSSLAHRRRNRSEPGIPGCPQTQTDADLRKLDHPSRALVAAVFRPLARRYERDSWTPTSRFEE